MWNATLTRREFVETCIGAKFKGEASQTSKVDVDVRPDHVSVYWEQPPGSVDSDIPTIAVASREDISSILTAIISSPTSPSPFTALCRLVTPEEAREKFCENPTYIGSESLAAIAALSMTEAMVLSDGRIPLRQMSPAACKRTFSYAWGRAVAAGASASRLMQLPPRWQQTYGLLNGKDAERELGRFLPSLTSILVTSTQVGVGLKPDDPAAELAFMLLARDKVGQERVWGRISGETGRNISIETLSQIPREERGRFLQEALRYLTLDREDDLRAAACAFIATKIAPGSLEHMDLLFGMGNPRVLFWYTLYAALQFPRDILALNNGLGRRVFRDMLPGEEPLSRPFADIAMSELLLYERIGMDNLHGKLGHQGEIEVEVLPYVTSSFTFPGRGARVRSEPSARQLLLDVESQSKQQAPTQEKLQHVVSTLTQLLHELKSSDFDAPPRRGRRK